MDLKRRGPNQRGFADLRSRLGFHPLEISVMNGLLLQLIDIAPCVVKTKGKAICLMNMLLGIGREF